MSVWIVVVGWIARLVLALLVLMSIYTLAVIIERYRFFKNSNFEEIREKIFEALYSKNLQSLEEIARNNSDNIYGVVLTKLFREKDLEDKKFSVGLEIQRQRPHLEKNLGLLATFGSITPFIGLLGTIFGIIVAFGELSTGKIDTNLVMYALAEALILTAMGLAVAIPSVMSFNYFSKKLKLILSDLDSILESVASNSWNKSK